MLASEFLYCARCGDEVAPQHCHPDLLVKDYVEDNNYKMYLLLRCPTCNKILKTISGGTIE